jgi:hypothetical protein
VKNMKSILNAAAVCLMVMAMTSGCAALSRMGARSQTLDERVKGYMQAQVDGKWDEAYAYLDAASKEKTSRERYVNQTRKAAYTGFEIEEITEAPSGDQAKVKLRLNISFMGYDLKRAPHTQTWVKEKGAWYVIPPSQQGNPFAAEEKKQ